MMNMTTRMRRLLFGALPFALAIGASTGCGTPDPEGELAKFAERTEDDRKTPDMGPINNGAQIDFSGTFLLGIVTPLGATPIMLETEVTVDENFVADFVFQPLKTDKLVGGDAPPREDPRTPVGDPIIVNDVQVEEDGTFFADLGQVNVAGDANPLTGRDIVAEIQLTGVVVSAQEFCGSAAGDVIEPIAVPLAGSSFGAVIIGETAITDIVVPSGCPDGTDPNSANNANATNNVNNTNSTNSTNNMMDMGTDMSVEPLVDQCLGDADLAILTGGEVDVSAEARTCGTSNLGAEDPVAAAADCIETETGLTAGCSYCYAETVGCSIENCLAACGSDPSGDACATCQAENGCISRLYECTGLPVPIVDACTNTADTTIIDGGDVDQDALASACYTTHMDDAEQATATRDCIVTDTGLSESCSTCYGDFVICRADNCGTECSDLGAAECATCLDTAGCQGDFDTCSGISPM